MPDGRDATVVPVALPGLVAGVCAAGEVGRLPGLQTFPGFGGGGLQTFPGVAGLAGGLGLQRLPGIAGGLGLHTLPGIGIGCGK